MLQWSYEARNGRHSSFLNLKIAEVLRSVDVGAHVDGRILWGRKRGKSMRKMKKILMAMLTVMVLVAQAANPVMAKETKLIPPENMVKPKLPPAVTVVTPDENLPKVEIVGIYTAWDETLPVGLKAQRSNILGTDRQVMAGKYVDCVVAIDAPHAEDVYNLEVHLMADPAANHLTAIAEMRSDIKSLEKDITKTVVDLQMDDEIMLLTTNSPTYRGDECYWQTVSWPYMRIATVEKTTGNLLRSVDDETELNKVGTQISFSDLGMNGQQHLEVTFRLYAATEEEWDDYCDFMNNRLHLQESND